MRWLLVIVGVAFALLLFCTNAMTINPRSGGEQSRQHAEIVWGLLAVLSFVLAWLFGPKRRS
jgi:drug/metabolite transporter (DMT)-like permease